MRTIFRKYKTNEQMCVNIYVWILRAYICSCTHVYMKIYAGTVMSMLRIRHVDQLINLLLNH